MARLQFFLSALQMLWDRVLRQAALLLALLPSGR